MIPTPPPEYETPTLDLLSRLEKARGLKDDESRCLEAIIRRQSIRSQRAGKPNRRMVRWSVRMDRELTMVFNISQRRAFCDKWDVTIKDTYNRAHILRQRGELQAIARGGARR
jgi:hypothetical protein